MPKPAQDALAVVGKDGAAKLNAEQRAALLAWFKTTDAEWQKLNAAVVEHAKQRAEAAQGAGQQRGRAGGAAAHAGRRLPREDALPPARRPEPEARRGDAGLLASADDAPDGEKHWQQSPPAGWRTSYRRRALANWITDTEHGAGHLLARVIVNRLWHHHFGRGIVATPSDFGAQGTPPTHPELLDWLAGELIRNGWRLKPIHKLIMTSAVYSKAQPSDPAKAAVDPDNIYLWRWSPPTARGRGDPRRVLAVTGELDRTMYGPGTLDEAMRRRSIYFTVKRSKLIPMLQLFDAPDANQGIGRRATTTVAPQALLLMNNPLVREWAVAMARRAATARDADARRSLARRDASPRVPNGPQPRPERRRADAVARVPQSPDADRTKPTDNGRRRRAGLGRLLPGAAGLERVRVHRVSTAANRTQMDANGTAMTFASIP